MLRDRLMQSASRSLVLVAGVMLGGTAWAQDTAPNDSCETATVIPSSAPNPVFVDEVDTTTATFDPADPLLSCNIFGDGDTTVWYEWTPAESGDVNITTLGSTLPSGTGELDTAHGMYVGSCGDLVEVACVDVGLNDNLLVSVEAGTTYRIKVGEFADGLANPEGRGGNLVLSVEESPFPEQIIFESARNGVSPRMRDLVGASGAFTPAAGNGADLLMEVPNMMGDEIQKVGASPASASSPGSLVPGVKGPTIGMPDVGVGFEGGNNDDNGFNLGILIAPPDTIGDVGRNHYVQMFNLQTEIFDKQGNTILGPFPSNLFFSGLGGQCENTNSGDPIVLYDEQTNRWFVSQFASGFPMDGLCIAISTSSDPTGRYLQYEFDFTGIAFPDYPKYGFATDSIAVMANLFTPFLGTGIGVIDKREALRPGPATMVFFILGPNEFGFIPGDNDGPYFKDTPATFFTNNFFSGSEIDVWQVNPDFRNPENSTVEEVAKVGVAPFDTDLCPAFRETCIAQPGSGTEDIPFLEAISDRMMHRAQLRTYRDDGETEIRAVMSHTVDADGTGKAGVRWYEMSNEDGDGWELESQNTFSPDGDNRWMGSVAMTKSGNMCLGYSVSSQETFPSIGVTGRVGDANYMNVGEAIVFDGNAAGNVQRQTGRWGDYSSMNIDPVDDSCWYTTEYARAGVFIGEIFGWGTRVVNFAVGDEEDDDDDDGPLGAFFR